MSFAFAETEFPQQLSQFKVLETSITGKSPGALLKEAAAFAKEKEAKNKTKKKLTLMTEEM